MASRTEVSRIKLPQHIEEGVTRVYDAAMTNGGSGSSRARSDLKSYFIDSVLEDEIIHPVAKASLAASISTSLVDIKDDRDKYHPIRVTNRKLSAMRAFLGSMKPDSIILLKDDDLAVRNTDDPQLIGETSVDSEARYPHIQSRVSFRFADLAHVSIGLNDPLDLGLSRSSLEAKEGVITLDGTFGNPEYRLKYLTGLNLHGNDKVNTTMTVGVARDEELYDYILQMYAKEPEAGTSKAYPPTVLHALAASVAVQAVSEGHLIAVPKLTHDDLREEYRKEISHTLISLAMRETHSEGVSETTYCCPSHGDVTSFRRRQNAIAKWSTEQLGIVLNCLDLTIDDLTPDPKILRQDASIGAVISDVINYEAVNAVMRDLRFRLSETR